MPCLTFEIGGDGAARFLLPVRTGRRCRQADEGLTSGQPPTQNPHTRHGIRGGFSFFAAGTKFRFTTASVE